MDPFVSFSLSFGFKYLFVATGCVVVSYVAGLIPPHLGLGSVLFMTIFLLPDFFLLSITQSWHAMNAEAAEFDISEHHDIDDFEEVLEELLADPIGHLLDAIDVHGIENGDAQDQHVPVHTLFNSWVNLPQTNGSNDVPPSPEVASSTSANRSGTVHSISRFDNQSAHAYGPSSFSDLSISQAPGLRANPLAVYDANSSLATLNQPSYLPSPQDTRTRLRRNFYLNE